jgi:hypothetical protein
MSQGPHRGPPKQGTSFRLTSEAIALLHALAQRYGLNHSDMLEVIIRDKARHEGLWPPTESTPEADEP